jgi:hypothetical protein
MECIDCCTLERLEQGDVSSLSSDAVRRKIDSGSVHER